MSDPGRAPASPVTLEQVRAHVHRLFCERPDDPLAPSQRHAPETVIDGFMFRFPMRTAAHSSPRVVTLYINPGTIGRQFWNQEFRTLLRIGDIGHGALPEIHDGGVETFDPPGSDGIVEMAYIEAGSFQAHLGSAEEREALRTQRPLLLANFVQLADALVTLHRDGLLHRNIQPSSIAVEERNDGGVTLRLTRFEQSTLLSDLLRRGIEFDDATASAALAAYLDAQSPIELACMAPERLEYLLGDEIPEQMPEQVAGDVFSLGIVAFQCFVEEIDPELAANAFPLRADDSRGRRRGLDRGEWGRLHAGLVARIQAAPIGPSLRSILMRMLEANPDKRLGSLDLVNELRQHDIQILEELSPSDDPPVRLVAIEPTEAVVLQYWGWISSQPLTTDDGRAELLDFLNEDLSDAWIEHAPDDLTRFIGRTDRPDELKKAPHVLRGKRGFYYGQLYESRGRRRTSDSLTCPHVFYIKFALQREVVLKHMPERQSPRLGRRVAPLRVVDRRAEEVTIPGGGTYPSWEPIIKSVWSDHRSSDAQRAFMGALRWHLAYQRVSLEARRYPFVRADADVGQARQRGQFVRLRYDAARDTAWRSRDAMRNQFMLNEDRRPRFEDFFGAREDRDFDGTVRWWPDAADGTVRDGAWRGGHGDVDFVEPDCITVKIEDGDADDVPAYGWVAPALDDAQRVSLDRQSEAALQHLAERPTLMAKLLNASTLLRPVGEWEEAAEGLIGERSRAALRRMLAADSIYVLQGPPGTGKTTVVARAVVAALREDPSIRILVSAQSHYALDNLAIAIRRRLPASALAVRLASANSESRVDPEIADLTRTALLKSRPQDVSRHVAEWLRNPLSQVELRPIVARWLDAISGSRAEIVDRTRYGANVVFSTCTHASETNRIVPGRAPDFDWVIVEEAAKAHATELVIPLVRGARWTLVGDHRQLAAYELREMQEFLAECIPLANEDHGLLSLLENASQFPEYFSLFERFFVKPGPRANPEAHLVGREKQPVDSLDRQFRMVSTIGAVVRDAFYPNALHSDRPDSTAPCELRHGRVPTEFGHCPLVWLNTDDDSTITGDGQRSNGEVSIVRKLMEQIWNASAPAAGELAILSPYRRQRDALVNGLPDRLSRFVHTVDSFQGHEARIIIVSLVRGYAQRPARDIYDRIGHLADDARANVLLSRARDLLVIVGQFSHFQEAGAKAQADEPGAFWTTICAHFSERGRVLSASRLFGSFGGDPVAR